MLFTPAVNSSNLAQNGIPRYATVVKAILPIELNHQPLLQITGCLPHDLRITVLEDMIAANLDLAVARLRTHSGLTAEVNELPSEVALVLRHILVQGRRHCKFDVEPKVCEGRLEEHLHLGSSHVVVLVLWSTK